MKCLNCQEEITSKYGKKFCSKSCGASYNGHAFPKRSKERASWPKCRTCDSIVDYRYNKHCKQCRIDGKHVHGNGPLDEQTIEQTLVRSGSNRYDNIRVHAKWKFRNDTGRLKCEKCGYDKHTELCHIKPISSFLKDTLVSVVNHRDNIMFLCPNCHWEFDHCL